MQKKLFLFRTHFINNKVNLQENKNWNESKKKLYQKTLIHIIVLKMRG